MRFRIEVMITFRDLDLAALQQLWKTDGKDNLATRTLLVSEYERDVLLIRMEVSSYTMPLPKSCLCDHVPGFRIIHTFSLRQCQAFEYMNGIRGACVHPPFLLVSTLYVK
ncbi:hypothetical protein CDAR_69281 [Caerostris darwini]|uniref:Uncharacterized protein n=1 Tax=Caerostris darwini TaxID=1538125 RepID=A0AAV4U0M8_9ARAC|nr:hypothetical protein CDAR_69281 [Caerostris darwini]